MVEEPEQMLMSPIHSRPAQATSRGPSRPLVPRIDPFAASRTVVQGELTPASSGLGSAAASPISPSSGRASPFLLGPRKGYAPVVKRPPSPELLSQDGAFPLFPTSQTKKKEQSSNNARTRMGDAHSIRSFDQERMRSASASAHRPRIRQGTGDSSRPSTANSSRAGSRAGSVDVIPPLPPLRPTVSTPSPDPSVLPVESEPVSTWPLPLDTTHQQDAMPRDTSSPQELTPTSGNEIDTSSNASPVTTNPNATSSSTSPATESQIREPFYKTKRPPPIANMPTYSLEQPSPPKSQPSPGPQPQPQPQPPPTPSSTIARTLTNLFGKRRGTSTSSKKSNSKSPATDGPRFIALSPDPDPRDLPRLSSSSHGSINTDMVFSPPIHGVQEAPNTSRDITAADHRVLEPSQAQIVQPEDDHEERHDETHDGQRDTIQMEEDLNIRLAAMTGAPRLSVVAEKVEDTRRASIDSASSYGSVRFTYSTTSSRSIHTFEGHSIGSSISTASTMSSSEVPLVPPPTKFKYLDNAPDSPTDPYLQHGRLAPVHETRLSGESARDEPMESYFQSESFKPVSEVLLSPQAEKNDPPMQPISPIPAPPPPEPETDEINLATPSRQRRPSTPGGIKGICRGCSKPIMSGQKSVSSKDGRLTGKYHKDCFACRTCKEPFATADFYVHDDHPYCAHHYHILNETICEGCGKGIEGHYLETSSMSGTSAKKFHPDCLKCATCKVQLGDDCFEMGGRCYCEKDAFRMANGPRSPYDTAPSRPSPLNREYVASGVAAGQSLTAGRFPERRMTKLMSTF